MPGPAPLPATLLKRQPYSSFKAVFNFLSAHYHVVVLLSVFLVFAFYFLPDTFPGITRSRTTLSISFVISPKLHFVSGVKSNKHNWMKELIRDPLTVETRLLLKPAVSRKETASGS